MGAAQAPLITANGTPLGELNKQGELEAWLRQRAKDLREESTLVHGDYKPGNIMFHPTEPKIVAILDWETVSLRRSDTLLVEIADVKQLIKRACIVHCWPSVE